MSNERTCGDLDAHPTHGWGGMDGMGWDCPGRKFSTEDVEDGVPGALEFFAEQALHPTGPTPRSATPTHHRPGETPADEALMASVAKELDESLDEPVPIKVLIPGIKPTGRGQDFWEAVPVGGHDGYWRILGDPNGVAVGKFKASLRKFLGVS